MGKNIIQQARGTGSPTYRAPSFRYKAKVSYPKQHGEVKIIGLVKCQGHSSPLAHLQTTDGKESFIIAAEGIRVGQTLHIGTQAPADKGNILKLKDIPLGSNIFNIELKPGDGGKLCRSSGSYARLTAKKENEVQVLLPSKKYKTFHPECLATVGITAGAGRKEKPFMKAGRKHYYMKARNKLYPRTQGIAMNAVDHPHGTSRSSKKGHPTIAKKNAPPGAKVGKIRPKRTGKK